MGLYEHLPYANFHELNLDAMIKAINALPDDIRAEVAEQLASFPIPSGSITSGKIASGAVTSGKLASDAVTTAKIHDDAVTQDKIADGAVGYDQLAAERANVTSGGSGGQIQVASSASTYTAIASVTVPSEGLYLVCPWVRAYGAANTTVGAINANINTTAGATGGLMYAAASTVAVPAFTTATDSGFAWPFLRLLNESDVLYLNVNHNTGQTRGIRGGIYIYRLA